MNFDMILKLGERPPAPSRRKTLKAIKTAVEKYRETELLQTKAYILHLCSRLDWTFQQALDWVDLMKEKNDG